MSLDENEGMLNSFSGLEVDKELPTKERIATVANTPLFFESDSKYGFNPEGVMRSINALCPDSFDLNQALFLLNNLDNLEHVTSHKYVESLIANFEKSVLEIPNKDNFTEIAASLLGLTILEISRTTRLLNEKKSATKTDFVPVYYNYVSYRSPQRDYQAELQYLQAQGGCNGGGNKLGSGLMESSLGVRSISHEGKTLNCTCPFCNTRVAAVISGGRIQCPHCGKSAEYHC